MMILGLGVDIEEITRFDAADERFIDLIFTPHEKEYCLAHSKPSQHFAGMFCLKEATVKALGKDIGLKNIEIRHEENGKPLIAIGGTCERNMHCSLSHSGDNAIGVVIRESDS